MQDAREQGPPQGHQHADAGILQDQRRTTCGVEQNGQRPRQAARLLGLERELS
jgi:hypothetical protein